jgi:Regulated-SNARE-like domain
MSHPMLSHLKDAVLSQPIRSKSQRISNHDVSSKRKCYSGALHRTQSRVFPSRAVRIHTSMSCNSCVLQSLCAQQSAAPCSYLIVDNVVYLTIADISYPRKLAFSYLDELSKEFSTSYGPKVETVRKPYAFVGFG